MWSEERLQHTSAKRNSFSENVYEKINSVLKPVSFFLSLQESILASQFALGWEEKLSGDALINYVADKVVIYGGGCSKHKMTLLLIEKCLLD